jgi:nucleoside diphosphate kinase
MEQVNFLLPITSRENITEQATFMMVKPDGLIYLNEINDLLKGSGLDANETMSTRLTGAQVLSHYTKTDDWLCKYGARIVAARFGVSEGQVKPFDARLYGGTIIPAIINYMTSGPIIISILTFAKENDGRDLFKVARDLLGNIEPKNAAKLTIRRFGVLSPFYSFEEAWQNPSGPVAIENIAHVSDSEEEAYREACLFLGREVADFYFRGYLQKLASDKNDDLIRLGRSVGK